MQLCHRVEQAFELPDASAECSGAGFTVRLNKAPIVEATAPYWPATPTPIAAVIDIDRCRGEGETLAHSSASCRWEQATNGPAKQEMGLSVVDSRS